MGCNGDVEKEEEEEERRKGGLNGRSGRCWNDGRASGLVNRWKAFCMCRREEGGVRRAGKEGMGGKGKKGGKGEKGACMEV